MTGYVTGVSIVDTHSKLLREFSILRGRRDFVIDDNDGAVRWRARGNIDLQLEWRSNAELVITYPRKARIIQQRNQDGDIAIRYLAMEAVKIHP